MNGDLQILTVTNNTRICVIPKAQIQDLAEALKLAAAALESENVILIRDEVQVLDANTILDHVTNYYFADYQ